MNTPTAVPDKGRLFRFYLWVSEPRSLLGLEIVLAQLRDVELLHILKDTSNQQALTIAWAEYGRRHTAADIKLSMRITDVLEVDVAGVIVGASLGLA